MKLIAITGAMGSGKSTAIEHLKNTHLKRRVELLKFAAPLYEMQEFIYRRIAPAYERTASFTKDRKLLQWLGTDWGRGLSETLWVDLWKQEIKYAQENYPYAILVCDDCRFDNEAQAVIDSGGSIIRITSERTESRIDTKSGIKNHASEAGISDKYVAHTIKNDYSVEEFHNALDEVLKKLL